LNSALLSRCQIFPFESLDERSIEGVIKRVLVDPRGLAGRFELTEDARDAIVSLSDGDARRALTILELILELASAIASGRLIDGSLIKAAVQRKGRG